MSEKATKHTPGPWVEWQTIKLSDYHTPERTWSAVEIKSPGYGHICDVSLPATDNDEQRANVRLIKAAPDLLEACKLVADDYRIPEMTRDVIKYAIAKATEENK